jgi:RNA polymerase sigma-70 factor, ECF subfamily
VRSSEPESSNPAADAAMDRYAAGDHSAFGELYDALSPRLYGFIMRAVHDRARAEDLVQQTLMQIHCAKGRFVPGSRVTPWAFAIMRHLFLDQKRRKHVELLAANSESEPEHPSDHPDPEHCSEVKQLEGLIRNELARLPPQQRTAVELVYYGQMTHAEAADVLGVTVASVKLRVHRANQAIRAALVVRPRP